MNRLQDAVSRAFTKLFGRTPLKQRVEDILGEAIEISRFTDMRNLREEAGDIMASTIMLCEECGWDYEELVRATLVKIEGRAEQYHTLGRKTYVAILGGAFNPITLGHVQIAQFILDASKAFDEVWLMPCFDHMFGKELESDEHRLAMANLAARRDGRIKVFDYEIRNQLSGETYQTVKMLQEEDFAKNRYDFSWVIGMDNANCFDKWVNYELLEKLIRFVVVPRQGVARDEKVSWYLKPPHIYLGHCENPIMEVSSTLIRDLIRSNSDDWAKYVDPLVYAYIRQHGLYSIKQDPLDPELGSLLADLPQVATSVTGKDGV